MTAFRKLTKLIKSLKSIRLRIQAVSSKVNIREVLISPQKDKAHIEHVQRCVLVRIDKKL